MPYYEYNSKKIYYSETGTGFPTILLHGNTASSKMFTNIIPLFSSNFHVVLLDFAGNGSSERLDCFPTDLWYEEALQVIRLIEVRNYKKVNLVGTSGGALVAINVALERPDFIHKLVADSFEGESALDSFASNVENDREVSKTIPEVKEFYQYNHGADWEQVVDHDTAAIKQHYLTIKKFFHHPLRDLKCDVLFTGSQADEFVSGDFFEHTYNMLIQKIGHGRTYLFQSGNHPAMISNCAEFANLVTEFLNE